MAGAPGTSGDLWIFGYGSLVWRPAFPHAEQVPAYLDGFGRRFWQGSTDHRGVPGAPGRVVTLVPRDDERCWGRAYRVAEAFAGEVLRGLDQREKGGYARHTVALGTRDGGPAAIPEALVYRATPDNPNYLGPERLGAIAAQVRVSRGPSGANLEYVLRLAAALREIGADDRHVFELETLLRVA